MLVDLIFRHFLDETEEFRGRIESMHRRHTGQHYYPLFPTSISNTRQATHDLHHFITQNNLKIQIIFILTLWTSLVWYFFYPNTLTVYYFFKDGRSYEYIPRDPDETLQTSAPFALLCAGYIPPTPINPTVAISIRSLELLRCLMRASSNFSIQSFARLLADFHHASVQIVYMMPLLG